jgi:hypothetical protein
MADKRFSDYYETRTSECAAERIRSGLQTRIINRVAHREMVNDLSPLGS